MPDPSIARIDKITRIVDELAAEEAVPRARLAAWFKTLVWDGVVRLPTFFTDYFGAPDTESTRTLSVMWFLNGAARGSRGSRVVPPPRLGCIPFLVGPQGVGKSSAIRALVPWSELFTDARKDLRDVWICDLADDLELNRVKVTLEAPRNQNVLFIGTCSEEPPPSRRYLPVHIHGAINISGIRAVRDQLWAEAYTHVTAKVQLPAGVFTAVDELAAQQSPELSVQVLIEPVPCEAQPTDEAPQPREGDSEPDR